MSLGLADEVPRQKAEQYAGMAKTPANASRKGTPTVLI